MSMVLSVFSQKAFREITLPDVGQMGSRPILLQKELFGIDKDIQLILIPEGQNWVLKPLKDCHLYGMDNRPLQKMNVENSAQVRIRTARGGTVSLLCFEQQTPFTVYRKYSLAGLPQITIGSSSKNVFLYHDPFVSDFHCRILLEHGRATLQDNSANGTFLNFQRVSGKTELKYGDSIRVMRLNLIYLGNMLAVNDCSGVTVSLNSLNPAEVETLCTEPTGDGESRVLFHRSPRNLKKLHTEPFEIEAPPDNRQSKEQPLAMLIGPSVTMSLPMVLGVGVSALASRASGAASSAYLYMGLITSISSAALASVWAVVNLHNSRKQRKQEENHRFERYGEYVIRMRDRIALAYRENADAIRDRYLSAEECCTLDEKSPLLWNRNPAFDDFLYTRLGIGDIPFQAEIQVPKERFTLLDDSLAEKPALVRENFQTLKDVPVTVDLQSQRLIGIAGGENRSGAISIAKVLIAQLASANCYTDVKIAIVYDESKDVDRGVWDFAKWLPHVWAGDKKIRYIATNEAEKGEVFYALSQILRRRSEEGEKASKKPRYILFVTDAAMLEGEMIAKFAYSREADLGITTIILSERPEDLPNECEFIIENDSIYEGIYSVRDGREYGTRLRYDRLADESLNQLAKNLGRVKVLETDEEGDIPDSISFLDMYGVSRPEELDVANRWRSSNSGASLRALIGFRGGNVPCYLDIHEKYHGPHGLLAGTTGSGKSETLQTYILSLALNFSPTDVGLFIIDYKGGGMANLFENLPHLIASVSNLSGNQVNRAMVSIKSENKRRMALFADFGVNNIIDYTALYKNGEASEPVPHLLIIIDEFAELKNDQPEFMKELISVAQVGRSLGVHLILSAQRTANAVDGNIWANCKFHLCLRVQDKQDSMDMLHRTEAAYLTQPGRCYLQVGNDEIFELFQSGYSRAPYDEEMGAGKMVIAQMLGATGKVELSGNYALSMRQEELRHRWVQELVSSLHQAEQEAGISVLAPGFTPLDSEVFLSEFYRAIQASHPDFEKSRFNSLRIADFCEIYAKVYDTCDAQRLVVSIIETAALEKKKLPELKGKTQMDAVIDHIAKVAAQEHIPPIPKLWLPLLPQHLFLEDMENCPTLENRSTFWTDKPRRFQLRAVIGKADDPENQAQFPVPVNFAEGGHHMLLGMVSTGKSTLAQTMVYSLAATYPPDLLNIYCLDFSSKMLSVFSDLPHVGAYLDEESIESQQIGKFFRLMARIMDERKEIFKGTSFEDYCNHNGWNVPAILIVIDNFGGMHGKIGEVYDSVLMRMVKEGLGLGIFLFITSNNIGMEELPNRIAENLRTGLALEMQDDFAYTSALRVIRPPVTPESRVRGRGLIYYGDRILEFQTALAARSEDGPTRNQEIETQVADLRKSWSGAVATPVPYIPKNPVRNDLTVLPAYRQALHNLRLLPIGYDNDSAEVYSLDLLSSHVFVIEGTRSSGKSNLMEHILRVCNERSERVYCIEIGGNQFSEEAEKSADGIFTDLAGLAELCRGIHEEIQGDRLQIRLKFSDPQTEEAFEASQQNTRINIFVKNLSELIHILTEDAEISDAADSSVMLDLLFGQRGRGYNIFIFLEAEDGMESEVVGSSLFQSAISYKNGIRFGGKLDSAYLSYDNVDYQFKQQVTRKGMGTIASSDPTEPVRRVLIPLVV